MPLRDLPVPAEESAILGRGKYHSYFREWRVDEAKNAGFACLDFEITQTQHYQHRYDATDASFTTRGRGDRDADGVRPDFSFSGKVKDGRLVLAPELADDTSER